MNIGMLWFDNSNKSVADKICNARTYYLKKYGRTPNVVYIHPSAEIPTIPGLTIGHSPSVKPNHFWLGVEQRNG